MTKPIPQNPADLFLHLIITFLTPMFLEAAGGDIAFARIAALETVNGYGARHFMDLLPIAQVIAFGLVTLDSLGRSMNEALSTPLVLRLRGNAVSLHRAAEKASAALHAPIAQETEPALDPEQEQALIADLARTQRRIAEANSIAAKPAPTAAPKPTATPKPTPQPTPIQPTPIQPTPIQPTPNQPATAPTAKPPTPLTMEETANRTLWATAMSNIARECTHDLINLPPAQRREATMRATALNSVARELLSNEPLPPSILQRHA